MTIAAIAQPGGYGIGWGAIALINAALAQDRGRSALGWFFGSMIVGPIATLLLVMWGKLPDARER